MLTNCFLHRKILLGRKGNLIQSLLLLGTSPETPLGPGIRDIECVCEEIARGRNAVSLAVNTSSVPCFSWHAALDSASAFCDLATTTKGENLTEQMRNESISTEQVILEAELELTK